MKRALWCGGIREYVNQYVSFRITFSEYYGWDRMIWSPEVVMGNLEQNTVEKKCFYWSCGWTWVSSMCLSLSTMLVLQREILPSLKLCFKFLRDSLRFKSLLLSINFRNPHKLHPYPSQKILPARLFKDNWQRGVLQAGGNCMPASLYSLS